MQERDTLIMLGRGLILLAIGVVIGFSFKKEPALTVVQRRANDPNLLYTNPLLSCGISEYKEFAEYKPLENTINALLEKIDPQGKSTASVYYKDLITGRWFGINETDTYSPASLLKVPIMIAYLKQAESNPDILKKRIYYNGASVVSNAVEYYKSPESIKAGNYYSVSELIDYMIKHSDNAATVLLFNAIDNNSLVEVMTDIGLRPPVTAGVNPGTDDYMTVKSYSFLFRLLYNSTYLNREMSEKALEILGHADFSEGIMKGLPQTLSIAEKFGERTILDASGTPISRELHDCGIVYYPNHPYLLCVMTKGNDFATLSTIISSISQTVYADVQNRYK